MGVAQIANTLSFYGRAPALGPIHKYRGSRLPVDGLVVVPDAVIHDRKKYA
jgi:hypothetical protein